MSMVELTFSGLLGMEQLFISGPTPARFMTERAMEELTLHDLVNIKNGWVNLNEEGLEMATSDEMIERARNMNSMRWLRKALIIK